MSCKHWRERDFLAENGWKQADLLDRKAARKLLNKIGRRWYIYVIWSSTPDATFPFYVGMGRGIRGIRHHEPSNRSENSIKGSIWERCVAAGGDILLLIVRRDLEQDEARAAERELIAKIGRRMTGTGPLSNLTEGGEGVVGVFHPKAGAAKLAKPLYAEGQLFPSRHEAATTLGVSPSAILGRLRSGWPGYHYVGQAPYPNRKGRKRGSSHPHSRAVVVEGVRYETLTDAANTAGLLPAGLLGRIQRGWPGYFYEDEGQRELAKPHRKYPVVLNGTEYPNLCAAEVATGINRQTIRWRIITGVPGYSGSNPLYQNGNTKDIERSAEST